jgi:hypothetical protein
LGSWLIDGIEGDSFLRKKSPTNIRSNERFSAIMVKFVYFILAIYQPANIFSDQAAFYRTTSLAMAAVLL